MYDKIDILDFINNTSSPFHVVKKCCDILNDNGFNELDFGKSWNLEPGCSYYSVPFGTTLFAFTVPREINEDIIFHISSAHTDYPCLRVKPNAETIEKDYLKLNVEAYGGLILNTWLDRPLSIAGKITLKSDNIYKPLTKLIDFKRPIITIPNLAIHINKEINKGVELNKQTDLEPIIGMLNDTLDKEHYFVNLIAEELSVSADDILDFDLYIYNIDSGCKLGLNDDFLSAPRLDNITSVVAAMNGLIGFEEMRRQNSNENINDININLIALYDNEEIGSRSKQGADSSLTSILFEKIFHGFKLNSNNLNNSIVNSFHLSVDVSHGLHPNHVNKNDPTTIAKINNGVVLKLDSTQKYASDTEAIAAIQQLCSYYDIKYQKFVNRSDITSGSTLGSIASSWNPMRTVDLGIPLLAMHSARELGGVTDQEELEKLIKAFFIHSR